MVSLRHRAHNGAMPQGPQPATGSTSPAHWFRLGWNLLNLSTVFGLLVALIGRTRIRRGPRGLFFAEGYRLSIPNAGAFTVGNFVITSRTMAALEQLQPGTLDHEDVHAWQYSYLLGLPYLPVYWVLCGWSWLRTGDPASANAFERQAGLARGGYTERPATNEGLKRIRAALTGRRPPNPDPSGSSGVGGN